MRPRENAELEFCLDRVSNLGIGRNCLRFQSETRVSPLDEDRLLAS